MSYDMMPESQNRAVIRMAMEKKIDKKLLSL
jgi:hypothetical protein